MAARLTLRLLLIQKENNRLSTVKIGRSIRLSGTRESSDKWGWASIDALLAHFQPSNAFWQQIGRFKSVGAFSWQQILALEGLRCHCALGERSFRHGM
jgi:hypothetical protein